MTNETEHFVSKTYVGTCSWKFDSWKGLIYDQDRKYLPNDYLPDYAKHFNTVEVDQWFWSLFPGSVKLPDPETVKIYSESVPDDFLFTVKAPNAITLTHRYAKQSAKYANIANQPNEWFLSVDLLKRFLDILQPVKSRLGPIMFQFEYLNRQKMSSLRKFINQLDEFFSNAPKDYDYAVEIRNPNYLKKDLSDFLKQHHIGTVLIEGYYMPAVAEVVDKIDVLTGDSLIIRLQGPDRGGIEKLAGRKWNRIVSPKDESLKSVSNIVKNISGRIKRIVININNHYEGCAVATAEKFREMADLF